ncbi:MAG: NADH:ubiquinone reductase (Na(+)-transporting) subunit B [Bacteroidales bacterium]|nr:NADH:ubiquinone reductase (Na(+)-transporting) subunit B [Bacteroidales bacterium]MDD3665703.1 NADH:ubiquinone reductase (Na(+)-transporting) subunit B [Bacteroidales bacterium]
MKALRKILDNIKPHVQPGGKFAKFHSTFDAFETFLFVPNTVTHKGSHIRDAIDLKRTMSVVVMALIPALLFGMYNVGYQHFLAIGEQATFWQTFFFGFWKVLPIVVVSYVSGLGVEFIFAQIRHHEVNEGFLVSGMLIPLVMPADVPLWMVAVATIFAVIIGKEVFGGTGMNILNPALLARAFLFFAYPQSMSGDKVWVSIGQGHVVDGFSGATPLGEALVGNIAGMHEKWSFMDMFLGFIPGSVGETSTLAILLGALLLLATGIGSWRIMLSVVLGGLTMGYIFNAFAGVFPQNAYLQLSPFEHLVLGGFAFGAIFMATDPVTAAQTNRGKWIYGFLIGVMAILIRVANPAYPEGMMLAILLLNVFAPLIDHYVVEGNISRREKRARLAGNNQ